MLTPFVSSFLGHFAARTPFPTEFTTSREIAHPVIRKLFKVSLISVVRSSDKVGALPKNVGEKIKQVIRQLMLLIGQSLTASPKNF